MAQSTRKLKKEKKKGKLTSKGRSRFSSSSWCPSSSSGRTLLSYPVEFLSIYQQYPLYVSIVYTTMQRRRAGSFSLQSPPSVLLLSVFFLSIATAMAEGSSEASVHIIYTEKPPTEDAESHHISTLTAVLGRSPTYLPPFFP